MNPPGVKLQPIVARRWRWLEYAVALVAGLIAARALVPPDVISGYGGLFARPAIDLAQNLTGHLAIQQDVWRWPLLWTDRIAWPDGLSIAMTDSNPLFSLIGMMLTRVLGVPPANRLGVFLALCFVLQPLAAVYALRGFGVARDRMAALAAAIAATVMAVAFPALLARIGHINLMAQFVLLLALGVALRMLRRPSVGWWRAFLVLLLAVLLHPYLFIFAATVLAAPLLGRLRAGRRAAWRAVRGYGVAVLVPVVLFALLSGGTGGADKGFGYYSMNLLSPVWPQRSGLFGATLPVLDATGGQYEGFNYLGGGGLLLTAIGFCLLAVRGRTALRAWWPLAVVMAGLTLLATTPRVYAGPDLLIPVGNWPLDQVFGAVRASGRAFWVVGYAAILGGIAMLTRRAGRAVAVSTLAVAICLQVADAVPLWRAARAYIADGVPPPVPLPVLPAGMTLLRIAPGCITTGPYVGLPDLLRLDAVRLGARIADMRASRSPRWFSCEASISDALETPLLPGEARALIGETALSVRPEALGPAAVCRVQRDVTLCARDLTLAGVEMPGPGLPLVHVSPPATFEGEALRPLLGTGWTLGPDGAAWSEGPRVALLFAAPMAVRLRLTLAGVSRRPGETREVELRVGDAPRRPISLPERGLTVLDVEMPAGPAWIGFDIYRPVDPATRALAAPVHRAAIRLLKVEILPAPTTR